MIPHQQKRYGTIQPQGGWSDQENQRFPPNEPRQGNPPQAQSQPIPVQPTANDVTYALLGDNTAETQVGQFSDKSTRMAFIRKVFAILACKLAVTVGVIALFLYQPQVNAFVQTNKLARTKVIWILFAAFVSTVILLIAIIHYEGRRRKSPANIILLGVFTIGESFVLGLNSAFYEVDEVLMAFGFGTAICLGLTIFAMQTKWDLTLVTGAIIIGSMITLTFGIMAKYVPDRIDKSLEYCSLGALLFSLYLVFNVGCLVAGNDRQYDVAPQEYVFASLQLYVDSFNIFMLLLRIFACLNPTTSIFSR